jgi:hypothetical protein
VKRALVVAAVLTACLIAAPLALLGVLWASLHWSPEGLDGLAAALLVLGIGWRVAWLHGKERTERRTP